MQKQQESSPIEFDSQTDSIRLGNGLFEMATETAKARLAKFASVGKSSIRQTFITAASQLCGIRLDAGPFQARWQFGDDTVEITRDDRVIDRIILTDSISKAA